jgi:hypothetical protein
VNDIIKEQETIREWNKYCEAYKKFHKFNDVDAMTDDELQILEKYNGFDNEEKPIRKKEKVYFIIFDDLISTGAFGNKKKSKLNNLIILCRHHHINIMITTQHIKAIPPIIRSNVKVFCIFKSNNYKKLLENIYQEISGIISQDKFEELYKYSTQKMHDALVVITSNDMEEKYKIRKNWTENLIYE